VENNALVNELGMLLGIEGKIKDILQSHLGLKDFSISPNLHPLE